MPTMLISSGSRCFEASHRVLVFCILVAYAFFPMVYGASTEIKSDGRVIGDSHVGGYEKTLFLKYRSEGCINCFTNIITDTQASTSVKASAEAVLKSTGRLLNLLFTAPSRGEDSSALGDLKAKAMDLMDQGAILNPQDLPGRTLVEGESAFHDLVRRNRADMVHLMLELGVNPAAVARQAARGSSPLRLAVRQWNTEIVSSLFNFEVEGDPIKAAENGVEVRTKTPLLHVCADPTFIIIALSKLILKHKKIEDAFTSLDGSEHPSISSAMHFLNNTNITGLKVPGKGIPAKVFFKVLRPWLLAIPKLLLENGWDPNVIDSLGRSALHVAAISGHTDLVALLIQHGATIGIAANDGSTAFKLAKVRGFTDIQEILLKHLNKEEIAVLKGTKKTYLSRTSTHACKANAKANLPAWRSHSLKFPTSIMNTSKCNIPIYSPSDITEDYLRMALLPDHIPFIIRPCKESLTNLDWKTRRSLLRKHWSRRSLLKRVGGLSIKSPSRIPYGLDDNDEGLLASTRRKRKGNRDFKEGTLKEYITQNMPRYGRGILSTINVSKLADLAFPYIPKYIFDDEFLTEKGNALLKSVVDYKHLFPEVSHFTSAIFGPEIEQKEQFDSNHKKLFSVESVIFFLGPPLSGAPMHYHSYAFNHLLYGRKKWTLLRNADVFYSNTPAIETVYRQIQANKEGKGGEQHTNIIAADNEFHCVQEEGDLIFVPEGYAHSTLNLEDGVGYAVEVLAWGGAGSNTAVAYTQNHFEA